MLYALAHFLRDKYPWIWDGIEQINSFLFGLRYKRKLKKLEEVLKKHQDLYAVEYVTEDHVAPLARFFEEQPEEAFKYFKPHEFDEKTIRKIQKSKSFLACVVKDKVNESIVGYFFLRCFFIGKCFRGYMVDYRQRNKGISKLTSKVMTELANLLGIPSYGTIAPENVASMKSQNAKIIKQLENGDYYVRYGD